MTDKHKDKGLEDTPQMLNLKAIRFMLFPTEAEALGYSPEKLDKVLNAFDKQYVHPFIDKLTERLGLENTETRGSKDMRTLVTAVRESNERNLFETMVEILINDLKGSYEPKNLLLITSIETGKFGAYSSMALFAYVLSLLEKQISVVCTSNNIFILGEQWALTAISKPAIIRSREAIRQVYKVRQEGKVENLMLSVTFTLCASTLGKTADDRGKKGDILAAKGKKQDAEEHYSEAQRYYSDALMACENAKKLNPSYASALNTEGNILYKMKKTEDARKAYEGAISLDPGCAEAWNNLGVLLFDNGEYEAALDNFKAAKRLNPELQAARNNIKKILRKSDDLIVEERTNDADQ